MSNRITLVSLAAVFCFASFACKQNDDPKPLAADNTAQNEIDRKTDAKTSFDQSESSSDITITADARRAVMKADNLSTNAKNCKIITDKGAVTLRGPVNNQAEKDRIGSLAQSVAGVVRVDNQLEVVAQ